MDVINVGIVGHIDHGKTTLLKQLSGQWTDTHSEELKRGITIKLGYADVLLSKDSSGLNIEGKGKAVRKVSFVDAPGHEMLMATMLSGAAMMDAAILVVAANEGIKPQTKEHVLALEAKDVKELIVVQNKIDLVSQKEAGDNYKAITELLDGRFTDYAVIPASAQQGVGVAEIWKALVDLPVPKRDAGGDVVFVVARSFDVNKPGTKPEGLKGAVLGGTLLKGSLKIGDKLVLKPGLNVDGKYSEIETSVLGLSRGSETLKELSPGGSMAIETSLDMALAKSDRLSGNVAGLKGKLPDPVKEVKVKYELFDLGESKGNVSNGKRQGKGSQSSRVEDIKDGEVLMLSVHTTTTGGKVSNVRKGEFSLGLQVPAVVFRGDQVGVARKVGGHWRLIGFGEIL
jgi:translation initiation factor 2 subunit 3